VPGIACLDADMTLVDNQTGRYNNALIQHLVDAPYDYYFISLKDIIRATNQSPEVERLLQNINQAGDAAHCFYMPFEQQ
jgi:hypothetical protein